jgi:hypothetical protein
MNSLRAIVRFVREYTAWSALAATTIIALIAGTFRLIGLTDPGHPFATRWSGGVIEAWGTIQDFWTLWITALVFGVMSLGGSASLLRRAPFSALPQRVFV